jgi:WD40 repeat protein
MLCFPTWTFKPMWFLGEAFRHYPAANDLPDATSLAMSRGGKTLAAGLPDGQVGLWDLATHHNRFTFTLPGAGKVTAVALGTGGKVLATASGDVVQLWELPPAGEGWPGFLSRKQLPSPLAGDRKRGAAPDERPRP